MMVLMSGHNGRRGPKVDGLRAWDVVRSNGAGLLGVAPVMVMGE